MFKRISLYNQFFFYGNHDCFVSEKATWTLSEKLETFAQAFAQERGDLTPYFPAKSFVIKLEGTKGDDENDWNTYIEYDCFSKERHIPGREHEDVDYARRNNKSNSGIYSFNSLRKSSIVFCLYRLIDFTLRFISSAISVWVLPSKKLLIKTVR